MIGLSGLGMIRGHRSGLALWSLLALAAAAFPPREASALIRGDAGNKPVADPGWPGGAAAIFNGPARVAWWEGPPFGGGQWHAECRGDSATLSDVLAAFARVEARNKRVVVHDGVGHSFWLNLNREPAKEAAARVDWIFMTWQPSSWEHLRKMPVDLNPTDPVDAEKGPPTQVDVFAGGNVRWAEVKVPAGIEVVDQRLEAHGFTPADGTVLEGRVVDLATGQPLAARMRLERVEPQPQPKGGYRYLVAAEAVADAGGRWVLRNAPADWQRVVIEADGYVPRVIGYGRPDGQPGWHPHDGGLSRPGPVAGRVVDDQGRGVADVEVDLSDLASSDGRRYELPAEPGCKTDADGRFRSDRIPIGRASIWLRKPGLTRPGLGLPVSAPAEGIEMSLTRSSRVVVTVDFLGSARLGGYMVSIKPEGGEAVGKYGGSADIDDKNQATFEEVPPGRYVLQGRPNPSTGDGRSDPVTVELNGGLKEVTLIAR